MPGTFSPTIAPPLRTPARTRRAEAAIFQGAGAASLGTLAASTGPPWYSTAWLDRMPVTVDNTANVSSALSYYQVGVSLTGSAYTSFAAHATAGGADIRVTDSDGTTLLSFALEGIDAANSVVYLLVKVPYVAAAGNRTIYVYYGNAAATSVSSYATAIGPTVAAVGPSDVYTQSDTANFNANSLLLRLKNQGGVNGGGAGLNGKVLCFLLSGANSNSDRANGDISLMSSTDGGVTWGGKTVLVASDATNMCEPRAVGELADGTILMAYSADTAANSSVGKAKVWLAKSTNGGATWTNLSLTPSNVLSVPWTYGSGIGSVYNVILEKTAGGDLFMPGYGSPTSGTTTSFYFFKCPAGSDPTIGSNWVVQGSIAYVSGPCFNEPGVVQLSSTSYLAFFRNDTAAAGGDLRMSSSTDSGATWGARTAIGLPGTVNPSEAVSPYCIRLASGNLLLVWGMRYGANWGIGSLVSTDNGATWLDRAPTFVAFNVAQTAGDGGYPTAVQNADGSICLAYYRELGGNLATCNVARVIYTEDYIVNSPNVYESCEALTGFRLAGANATLDTAHIHTGTNAIKIDNSVGTGGINDYVVKDIWSTNLALQGPKVALSWWAYETANDSSRMCQIKDSQSLSYIVATGERTRVYVLGTTSDHISWYNGSSQQDTGVVCPANQWAKIGMRASMQPASVTGEIRLNNVSLTTGLGQSGSGGNAQQILIQGGSTGSTHNVIFWLDDVYTHQYTPSTPTTSTGTEQTFSAPPTFTAPSSGAASLAALIGAGVSQFTASASGAATLTALVAAGVAGSGVFGTGAASLTALTALGAGAFTAPGSGAATLTALVAAGVAGSGVFGTGAASLVALTVAGSGAFRATGVGVATLGVMTAAGSATGTVVLAGLDLSHIDPDQTTQLTTITDVYGIDPDQTTLLP